MFVKPWFPASVAVLPKLVIFGLGIQFNSPPVPAPEPERSTPNLGNSCSLPCKPGRLLRNHLSPKSQLISTSKTRQHMLTAKTSCTPKEITGFDPDDDRAFVVEAMRCVGMAVECSVTDLKTSARHPKIKWRTGGTPSDSETSKKWFFNFPYLLVNLLLSVILPISLPSTIHRSVHPLAINESMNNPLKFYAVLDVWPPFNKLIFPLIGFFPVFPIKKIVDASFTSAVWENLDPMSFLNIFPWKMDGFPYGFCWEPCLQNPLPLA